LSLTPPAHASLIGQWTFNEGSGSVATDTAGSNNGTLSNGASYIPNGAGNYAVHFGDGSGSGTGNDSVVIPDSPTFDMGKNFSIEAWVKLDTNNGGVDWFFGTEHSSYARYGLLVAGGQYRFDVGSYLEHAPDYFATASTPASVGSWDHLVGTFDGATIKLYKNGSLAGSTPWVANDGVYPTSQVPAAGPFYYNQGSIDQVQLWNETLSDSQVLTLYQPGPIAVPEPATTAAVVSLAMVALGSRKRRQ
jgi:hypothetical protein